jgi:hypothetical protein
MNDKFIGLADYIVESIHDLLVSDLESISNSTSSQGSYHPSHECFMAEIVDDTHHEVTPEGHIMSANDGAPHGGIGLPHAPLMGVGLRRMQKFRPTHV